MTYSSAYNGFPITSVPLIKIPLPVLQETRLSSLLRSEYFLPKYPQGCHSQTDYTFFFLRQVLGFQEGTTL